MSSLPVRMVLPSRLNATARTWPCGGREGRRAGRSVASQSRAVLSMAARQGEPAVRAELDRADRAPACCMVTPMGSPVAALQSRAVPSSLPVSDGAAVRAEGDRLDRLRVSQGRPDRSAGARRPRAVPSRRRCRSGRVGRRG